MDLRTYIAESERVYHYRIKTVAPLDAAAMDRIERALAKYQPIDVSRPKKTMLQAQPLEFYGVSNAEVWIVDIATGLPASSYVLQQELRNALDVPEKYVVVRADNEPLEIENDKIAAEREMDEEAKQKGLMRASLLSTDPAYMQGEEPPEPGTAYYGNDYNSKLLDYLYAVQQTRKADKVDSPEPLFSWMDMPKGDVEDADFNKAIPDAPKPASLRGKTGSTANPPVDHRMSMQGNLDDDTKTYARRYKKASDAKSSEMTRTVAGIRKGE